MDTGIFTAIFVPLGLVVQIGLALFVGSGTGLRKSGSPARTESSTASTTSLHRTEPSIGWTTRAA